MKTSGDILAATSLNFYRPQRSWGKVMFLQASVILLTGGGWSRVPGGGRGVCSGGGGAWSQDGCLVCREGGGCLVLGGICSRGVPGGDPPDGHCCRWYASYWNAFLLSINLHKQECIPVGCVPPAHWPWGCICPGGCTCLGGCTCPRGVPARRGGTCPGGVPAQGVVYLGQNSWHTLLKILPCPNFVAGGNKRAFQ